MGDILNSIIVIFGHCAEDFKSSWNTGSVITSLNQRKTFLTHMKPYFELSGHDFWLRYVSWSSLSTGKKQSHLLQSMENLVKTLEGTL